VQISIAIIIIRDIPVTMSDRRITVLTVFRYSLLMIKIFLKKHNSV